MACSDTGDQAADARADFTTDQEQRAQRCDESTNLDDRFLCLWTQILKLLDKALDPGDNLFVYTDGVPEATDAHNELFGTERMLEALNEDPKAKPEELLYSVQKNIDAFVGDAPQFDDITMMSFNYFGEVKDSKKSDVGQNNE